MELKDFIVTVLVDIEQGINQATILTRKHTFLDITTEDGGIDFDVAVIAGTEASGGVKAEVFSVGGKAEGKIKSEEVSRIKFRIRTGQYFKTNSTTESVMQTIAKNKHRKS